MAQPTLKKAPDPAAVIKKHNMLLIGVAVQFIFTFFFGMLVKPWGEVTQLGVCVIGVFFGALLGLIIGNNMLWPALIASTGLVWWGYFKNGSAAAAAVIGNPTIYQLIFVSAIAYGINASNAGEIIANKFLRIPFVQGRPILMSMTVLIGFVVAGNFMGGFVMLFIAYPILNNMLDQAGMDKGGDYANLMRVGIYLSAMLGGAIKGPINALSVQRMDLFDAVLSKAGVDLVDRGQYVVFCFFCLLAFFVLLPFAFRFVFRCDMSKLKNTNFRTMEGMEAKKFNKRQIILIAAFFFYALYTYFLKLFPAGSFVRTQLTAIGQPAWGAVVVVILMCIRVKGTPIFDAGTCFRQGIDWGLCFIMGTFTAIGGALVSSSTGIQPWLSRVAAPIFDGKPAILLIFLVVVFNTIVTNFFSNTATGTIFAAIGAAVCLPYVTAGQLNPTVLALACNLCSSCAFLTWSACGAAPLLLAEKGVTSKFIWTKGVGVCVIFIIVCTVVLAVCSMVTV